MDAPSTDFSTLLSPETAENLPPGAEELAERARRRAEDLLGPIPPEGLGANRKGEVGPCRVCGQTGPLTFEHMPPRSAGNHTRRRMVDMTTDLAHPIGVFPPRGWIQVQKGMGAYATCGDCNSFSGSDYVPAYTDFVASLVNALHEWAQATPDDHPPKTLSFTMSRGKPGDIVRQALFMILTSSGSPGLGERYPVLRDIVLRKAPASLPAEMTLRLSLVITPRARMIPLTGEANLDRNAERALVEVACSPLGWLLEVGDPSDRTSANVSSWTQIPTGSSST